MNKAANNIVDYMADTIANLNTNWLGEHEGAAKNITFEIGGMATAAKVADGFDKSTSFYVQVAIDRAILNENTFSEEHAIAFKEMYAKQYLGE